VQALFALFGATAKFLRGVILNTCLLNIGTHCTLNLISALHRNAFQGIHMVVFHAIHLYELLELAVQDLLLLNLFFQSGYFV
jgi:hypothetical protein